MPEFGMTRLVGWIQETPWKVGNAGRQFSHREEIRDFPAVCR
jgi:hypothetical protein